MRVIELITEFKQFLNAQGSSIGTIALALALCLIVLSFAAREVFSWMTKSDHIRADLKDIRETLHAIEARLERVDANKSIAPETSWPLSEKQEAKEDTFRLNH